MHQKTSRSYFIKWTTSGEPPVGLRNHTPGIYVVLNYFLFHNHSNNKTKAFHSKMGTQNIRSMVLTASVLLILVLLLKEDRGQRMENQRLHIFINSTDTAFFVPTGAQEILMFDCLFVPLCQTCLEQSIFIILAQIFKQRALKEHSESTQKALRRHSESTQSIKLRVNTVVALYCVFLVQSMERKVLL